MGYVGSATQPIRYAGTDGKSDGSNDGTEDEGTDESVAEHLTGLGKVVGTNKMSHLHRETHRGSTRQTATEPRRRLYQSASSGSLHTDSPHHGLVDEEHHDTGDLG